jgi:hypothetical protein
VPSALATTYYVSAAGKDSNSGTSTTAPFLTIKKAADLTKPGDIVNVMDGTYGPFIISHAGSQSGGYITYQAYPGQHPTVLKNGTTWDGIQIWNSAGAPLISLSMASPSSATPKALRSVRRSRHQTRTIPQMETASAAAAVFITSLYATTLSHIALGQE